MRLYDCLSSGNLYLLALICGVCLATVHNKLTFVNNSNFSLNGVVVQLPLQRIYNILGLKEGSPLQINTVDGVEVPTYHEEIPGILSVFTDLPPLSKKDFGIVPSSEWFRISLKTNCNPDVNEWEISNKSLSFKIEKGVVSLLTSDGTKVFDGLKFVGWLTENEIRIPSAQWAMEQGILRVSTADFSSLIVENTSPFCFSIKKVAAGELKEKIIFNEILSLHPTMPLGRYQLTIENLTEKPLFIADCEGAIFAKWGKAMEGKKFVKLPTGDGIPITEDWMCVWEWHIPIEDRVWLQILSENGPTLSIFNLNEHFHNWALTNDGLWLHQTGEDGERPIKIPPKGKTTFAIAFAILTKEMDSFSQTKNIFLSLKGTRYISTFLNDRPLLAGKLQCLEEDFHKPDRWLLKNGKWVKGKFISTDGKAEAEYLLSLSSEKATELMVNIEQLVGEIQINICNFEGKNFFQGKLVKPGSYRWNVDIGGEVIIKLVLEGKGSRAKLTRLYFGPPLPSAPTLLFPWDALEIADIASFFTWKPVKGAEMYEVQLSRSRKFTNPLCFYVPELKANKSVFFPPKPLEKGRWYWRVRGINEDGGKGEFSDARSIRINSEHKKSPLVRPLSNENPLFIFHSPTEIEEAWATIPNELKPYCALRVEVAERGLDIFEFCRRAEKVGANIVIQCSGPGGGVYSELYDHKYGRQSLSELEMVFKRFPNVAGAIIVEQFFSLLTAPLTREYVKRLIQLCAKYGRFFIYADGHWVRKAWLLLGEKAPDVMKLMREYKENVILLWKMNCGWEPLTIHGSILGIWLCGMCEKFGVEPEDWYWSDAGFLELGKRAGMGLGERDLIPPTFWGQMMLMGLATGGTCWCLEGWHGLWDKPNKPKDKVLIRTVFPLMKAILRWKLIPSKDEVLKNIKIACKVRREDLYKGGDPFGPFNILYDGTYGIKHPSELIPDNGRYFFIPLLPLLCDKPPKSFQLFKTDKFSNPSEVKKYVDVLYKPFYEGDAFVVKVGNLIVAMNSRENEDVMQSFKWPIEAGKIKLFEGELGPHSYMVGKVEGGKLLLLTNGREEKQVKLRFTCCQFPILAVSPSEALVDSQWEDGRLILIISYQHGTVEIEIR